MTPLAVLLALIFLLIAALHVYWGFGGSWARAEAIPQTPDGRSVFTPGPTACFAVAIVVGGFSHFCLASVKLAPLPALPFPRHLLVLGISAIFAARTLGDFRYFGLFRRIRDTPFARRDRLFYTPLCAALCLLLAALAAGTR